VSARVKAFERWALRLGFLLATATGLAYGYIRYFLQRVGDFGPEAHPWQSVTQHAHVLTAPLLLFALGIATRGHILGMLQHGVTRGRRTGLLMAWLTAPLVLGGYAIQVVTGAGPRAWLGWIHAAISVVFVAAFAVHWLKPPAGFPESAGGGTSEASGSPATPSPPRR
jgi:hypothetical protein